jgi:hypothetical protein
MVDVFQKYPDAQLHAVPFGLVTLRELETLVQLMEHVTELLFATNEYLGWQPQVLPAVEMLLEFVMEEQLIVHVKLEAVQ